MRVDVIELGVALDGDADLSSSVAAGLRRYRYNKLMVGGAATMAPLIEWHQDTRTIVAQYDPPAADEDDALPEGACALQLLRAANSVLERYGPPVRITSLSEGWHTIEGEDGVPVAVDECLAATGIERAGIAATWSANYRRDPDGTIVFDPPVLMLASDGHVIDVLRGLMDEMRRTS